MFEKVLNLFHGLGDRAAANLYGDQWQANRSHVWGDLLSGAGRSLSANEGFAPGMQMARQMGDRRAGQSRAQADALRAITDQIASTSQVKLPDWVAYPSPGLGPPVGDAYQNPNGTWLGRVPPGTPSIPKRGAWARPPVTLHLFDYPREF